MDLVFEQRKEVGWHKLVRSSVRLYPSVDANSSVSFSFSMFPQEHLGWFPPFVNTIGVLAWLMATAL